MLEHFLVFLNFSFDFAFYYELFASTDIAASQRRKTCGLANSEHEE